MINIQERPVTIVTVPLVKAVNAFGQLSEQLVTDDCRDFSQYNCIVFENSAFPMCTLNKIMCKWEISLLPTSINLTLSEFILYDLIDVLKLNKCR